MSFLSQVLSFSPMAGGAICGLGAAFAPSPHSIFLAFHALKGTSSRWVIAFLLGAFCFEISLVLLISAAGQSFSHSTILIMGWIGTGYLLKSAMDLFFIKSTASTVESQFSSEPSLSSAIRNGFVIQLFNPNPYLFWTTIGLNQLQADPTFTLFFFIFLNTAKYSLAILLSRFGLKFPVQNLARVSAVLLLLACFLMNFPK